MGQYDFPSATALDRLRSEDLPTSPAARLTAKIAEFGGTLAEAIGMKGASTAGALYSKLIESAPPKDEANLLYFAEWVVWDLKKLYELQQRNEGKWKEIEERIRSTETGIVLVNATLYVPRTNVASRLQRMAHIFVNGVNLGDLEPERTDDMMRAAIELNDIDLTILRRIYDRQVKLLEIHERLSSEWAQQVGHGWTNDFACLDAEKSARSSLSKLQSFGFVGRVTSNIVATGELRTQPYGLLPEGKVFCERIQEVAKG